jgi:hypothetical protein
MSEPNTQAAGEGVSDEEMVDTVAEQTDSASTNADTAGKDWNGDVGSAPAPGDRVITGRPGWHTAARARGRRGRAAR